MAGIHIYLKRIYSRKPSFPPMIILYSAALVKHRPPAKKGSSVCLNRTTKVPFPVRCIQIFILLPGLTQLGAFQADAEGPLNTLLRWLPGVKVVLPRAWRNCQIPRKSKSESLCTWYEAHRTFWVQCLKFIRTLKAHLSVTWKWLPILYRKLDNRLKSLLYYHAIEWQANEVLTSVPLHTGQDKKNIFALKNTNV